MLLPWEEANPYVAYQKPSHGSFVNPFEPKTKTLFETYYIPSGGY